MYPSTKKHLCLNLAGWITVAFVRFWNRKNSSDHLWLYSHLFDIFTSAAGILMLVKWNKWILKYAVYFPKICSIFDVLTICDNFSPDSNSKNTLWNVYVNTSNKDFLFEKTKQKTCCKNKYLELFPKINVFSKLSALNFLNGVFFICNSSV